MSKRPSIDLMALTTGQAEPMAEAVQRMPVKLSAKPPSPFEKPEPVRTENLEALAFKVSPSFRKRFRQRAVDADLKLNELLFAALDAWEEKHKVRILAFRLCWSSQRHAHLDSVPERGFLRFPRPARASSASFTA